MQVKRRIITLAIFFILASGIATFGQTLLEQGIFAFNLQDYQAAAEYITAYIETNPYSQSAYEYLINSYLALKQSENALTTLEQAVHYFPNNAEFYKLLGQLYTQHEQYEKSHDALQKYLELKPDDYEAIRLLSTICYNCGIVATQKGDYYPAVDYFDQAIALDSSYMEAYQNMVAVFIETSDLEKARDLLQKAIKRFPYNDTFQKAYFDVLIRQEKYREALPVLENIRINDPDNIDLALQLGILYRHLSEIDRAMALYNELIEEHPRERKIYQAVIDYWSNFNRQDKIRQTYELMLETFPDDIELRINIAKTYEKENDWQTARYKYDMLILEHPENSQVRLLKATTYIEENSDQKAIPELLAILDYDPENYDAMKELGNVYDNLADTSNSLELYRTFYDCYNEDYYAAYHFGLALKNNAQPDSAELFMVRANKLASDQPSPYYALGEIAADKNDIDKATGYFKEALSRAIKYMSNLQHQAEAGITSGDGAIKLDQLSQYETLHNQIQLTKFIIEGSLEYLKAHYSYNKFGDLLIGYLRLYPSSVFLHLYQARWYDKGDKMNEAISSYKKALSLNPRTIEAHQGLALIYEKRKNYDQAKSCYQRIISIEPGNSDAYDNIIDISEKQGALKQLGDEWLEMFEVNPKNEMLGDKLIEVFHKTGQSEKAKVIVETLNREKSKDE